MSKYTNMKNVDPKKKHIPCFRKDRKPMLEKVTEVKNYIKDSSYDYL